VPKRGSTGRFELKPMQELVLGVLREDGAELLTRARYQEITGVSRSQAAYDLAELVEDGILVRLGGGRATRYRLTAPSRPSRPPRPSANGAEPERKGRRHWTNERIRAELERFCAERKTWPSPAEFRAAGHSDLYVAASRYGGVGFWASELGFSRPGRTEPPARAPVRPRRRLGPRLRWVASAAVGAAALLAVGGANIDSWHGVQALSSALPLHAAGPTFVPKRDFQSAASVKPSRAHAPRKVQHVKRKPRVTPVRQASAAPAAPAVQTSASRTDLAAVRTPAPTYTPPSQPQSTPRTTQPTSSSSSGPAPLPPPPGGSGAPQPIPPPRR
jgi:hypothetical protein